MVGVEVSGMLAVISRNAGVARVWGRSFNGFFAWLLWLAVHIFELIGFRNRMLVLINWGWNYISYERAVRLILPSAPESGFEEAVAGRAEE
jgi:NADH dehydrogenase